MGERQEEVNAVFLIKMGVMPSYTNCMKNLNLTFIISAYAMFFQNNPTDNTNRETEVDFQSLRVTRWQRKVTETMSFAPRLHAASARNPCVRLGSGGHLRHPEFSPNHLGRSTAHEQGPGWAAVRGLGSGWPPRPRPRLRGFPGSLSAEPWALCLPCRRGCWFLAAHPWQRVLQKQKTELHRFGRHMWIRTAPGKRLV